MVHYFHVSLSGNFCRILVFSNFFREESKLITFPFILCHVVDVVAAVAVDAVVAFEILFSKKNFFQFFCGV